MSVDRAERKGETTRLGSYEILRKLARGGMAELYLARALGPQGFEKLVVLKKILPQYAANTRFVRLFLDEAKLAAGLEHPNIAHVFDMGMVDGNYFFTMEFIHGQDVRSTLHRGWQEKRQLPIEHAVNVARSVASALHYAHERQRADGALLGIVHRDVSPSNIMLSYDGTIKLLDFGVAKASNSSTKTRTGMLKGKVSYMSPEQAKGSPIDRRSDIFSLGIVLWEMITGARLFKGENDLATIQMIINETAPSPRVLRPDCPPELERIVAQALSPDPETRIATGQQLQLELEELARENKLGQSSVSLGAHMALLFATELKHWKAAQSAGVSLGEYVMGGEALPTDSVTAQVSKGDFSIFEEEIDEYDDELEEIDEPDEPDAPVAPVTPIFPKELDGLDDGDTQMVSAPFDLASMTVEPAPKLGKVVPIVAKPVLEDSTDVKQEVPTASSDSEDEGFTLRDAPAVLPVAIPLAIPKGSPSGPVRTGTGPAELVRRDQTPIPTEFPVVRRDEWARSQMPPEPPPVDEEAVLAKRRLKQAGIAGAVVVVLLVLSVYATPGPSAPKLPAAVLIDAGAVAPEPIDAAPEPAIVPPPVDAAVAPPVDALPPKPPIVPKPKPKPLAPPATGRPPVTSRTSR